MSTKLFEPSSMPLRKVVKIQFGILNPDDIRKSSRVHVEFADCYENGRPKEGGLLDLRMGPVDGAYKCDTCNGSTRECPGHFGHIELAKPGFHEGFMKPIMDILKCICFNCARLRFDPKDPKMKHALKLKNPAKKLKAISEIANLKKVCDVQDTVDAEGNPVQGATGGCGYVQPSFKREGLRITAEFRDSDLKDHITHTVEKKQYVSAEKIYLLLKQISDANCEIIGLNPKYTRPDWMILTVLPVPPPHVRPSIQASAAMKSEDDLTTLLFDIVKSNNNLKKQTQGGASSHIIADFCQQLQRFCTALFNNELPNQRPVTRRGGGALKSISQRLKGKEGRIRGNLMGKRCDFTARSVITGDAHLNVDELGVPKSIAMNLTFPETVTPYNIDRMYELVRNGPNTHPGAKFIIRDDGTRFDLRIAKKESDHHLDHGYKVERHIQDGDIVVFNRQPSLHKMSMMGHRIRIMPYSTFRLNLTVTTPYNADFDGDEMNMHVPQSLPAIAEVSELMMVPRNFISPQANKPVMGIVQDSLLACGLFTRRDTFLEKDMVMNLLMWIDTWDGKIPTPAILKPKELWTGKQIMSLIIPPINLDRIAGGHDKDCDKDTQVLIEKGQLLMGILDSHSVGSSSGGIIHTIQHEHGPQKTKNFIFYLQQVVTYWMLHHGFTVGIGDCFATPEIFRSINATISEAKVEVAKHVKAVQTSRDYAVKPGMTVLDSFEYSVSVALNQARDNSGKFANMKMNVRNNIRQMVTIGSKGKDTNIAQIVACVGPQSVTGKRIPFGFKQRTLPHFNKDDYGPESRGFVSNSYLQGLTPQEFFFHAMGGREGLIDTACKTAETGYIQRRLVKAMEDVMVKYDGTVRNALGDVVQFVYGEDGIDATQIENQKMDIILYDNSQMERKYRYTNFDSTDFGSKMSYDVVENIRNNQDVREQLDKEFRELMTIRDTLRTNLFYPRPCTKEIKIDHSINIPVNLKRLVWSARNAFDIDLTRPSDLHPLTVIEGVNKLCSKLIIRPGDDPISKEVTETSSVLMTSFLKSTQASKRVIEEWRMDSKSFEWILGEIESRYLKAIANPGEMVGALAAQSLGEPTTQMTLNTFHLAGVASKLTEGVPRLRELINIAKSISTPSLKIELPPEIALDADLAKQVRSGIEYAVLSQATLATEIWYDPNPRDTIIEEDKYFVLDELNVEENSENLSPWLLRLVLDNVVMAEKEIEMKEIAERISNQFVNQLSCLFSDDNAAKLVFRIRLVHDPSTKGDETESDEEDKLLKTYEETLLSQLALRGILGISKVFLTNYTPPEIDSNGEWTVNKSKWHLETEGCGLLAVMSFPKVLSHRVMSNHIMEIIQALGIEAVRNALLNEIRSVFYS